MKPVPRSRLVRMRLALRANSYKLALTGAFALIAAIVFGATLALMRKPSRELVVLTCALGALAVVWFYARVSYWEMRGAHPDRIVAGEEMPPEPGKPIARKAARVRASRSRAR